MLPRAQVAATLVLIGCGAEVPTEDGRTLRTETDQFGIITCSAETETRTCHPTRAIPGVSRGAGGAGEIGFTHPELFDTIGLIGSPLVDWIYFLRNVKRSYLGGFCDRETIVANLSQVSDPGGSA